MSLSHLLNAHFLNAHFPIWSPRSGGVGGGGGGAGENFYINGREARVLGTGGGGEGGGGGGLVGGGNWFREHQEAYDMFVVTNSQKYSL
jgi:hypothetical protein